MQKTQSMNSNLKYNITPIKGLRITLDDIQPYLLNLNKDIFDTRIIGYSEQNRPIYRVQFGKGTTKILLWTQMHGNESTATKSTLDVFNIVNNSKITNVNFSFLENCTLFCIPILNPDGAHLYTRENALGNDLNRDAQTILNIESKILWEQVQEIQPDFAFNLHDQTAFYNVSGTNNIASISLLAPAVDEARTLTESRKTAMSIIVGINEMLQKNIPQQVGRYNDSYCNSCFGDSIQRKNIPTILVECGYFLNDEEREMTRNVHTNILLTAFENISASYFPDYNNYFEIPENDKKYYDLKITNVIYLNKLCDVGIRFKTVFQDGKLKKIVDEEETIILESNSDHFLFYRIIDGKNDIFDNLLKNI